MTCDATIALNVNRAQVPLRPPHHPVRRFRSRRLRKDRLGLVFGRFCLIDPRGVNVRIRLMAFTAFGACNKGIIKAFFVWAGKLPVQIPILAKSQVFNVPGASDGIGRLKET